MVCWLGAIAVVAVTWWDSGEQALSATQLPALLVALGIGTGLFVVGGALWVLDRARARARVQARLLADVVSIAEGAT